MSFYSSTDSEDERWQALEDDSEEDAVQEEETPADKWFEEMKILLLNRTLTAQNFCTLIYNATHEKNGRSELAKYAKFGKKPNLPSGHYQRHLRQTMPMYVEATPNYELELVVNRQDALGRTTKQFAVLLPQEELEQELASIPNWKEDLKEAIEKEELPVAYDEHPIVQQNEWGTVLPIGIFIDGVPYNQIDTIEGYWVINLLTQRRHFVAGLRKTLKCNCSCKGWCSQYQIFKFLNWQIECLAEGKRPSMRHDGKEWQANDQIRATMAGQESVKAAVVFIKGDWAEYGNTMGFPTWNNRQRPCYCCNASPGNMQNMLGISASNLLNRSNEEQDYFNDCERCEIRIVLRNQDDHKLVQSELFYDKGNKLSPGRVLKNGIPSLGLKKGDRLELCERLQNLDNFDVIGRFPTEILFWRKENEVSTKRRNPLFNRATGVTPQKTMTSDLLHAMYLGTMKRWCKITIWKLIEAGTWGEGIMNFEELFQKSILTINNQLDNWYKRRHRSKPEEKLTRCKLTKGKLGTRTQQDCRTKGAQTWGLLNFLLDVLETRKNSMPDREIAEKLFRCGKAQEGHSM